jgi:hypothetical protein
MSRRILPFFLVLPVLHGCFFGSSNREGASSWFGSFYQEDDDYAESGEGDYAYDDWGYAAQEPIAWNTSGQPQVVDTTETGLTAGSLEGDAGYVSGIAANHAEVAGWAMPLSADDDSRVGYLDVTVTGTTSNASAMVMLTFDGDLAALAGQGPVGFDAWGGRIDGGGDGAYVNTTVCSGAQLGFWSFDVAGSEVTLEVEEVTTTTEEPEYDVTFAITTESYNGPGGTVRGGFRLNTTKAIGHGGGYSSWNASPMASAASLKGSVGPVTLTESAYVSPWVWVDFDRLVVQIDVSTDTSSAVFAMDLGAVADVADSVGALSGVTASGYLYDNSGYVSWDGYGDNVSAIATSANGVTTVQFDATLRSPLTGTDSHVAGSVTFSLP